MSLYLETRRTRGWLAFRAIMLWPARYLFSAPKWLLGWAGLYAHWDYDRANWREVSR